MKKKLNKSEFNIDKILDELASFEELQLPLGFNEELEKKLILAKDELDFEKNGIYYNRFVKKESFNRYIWKRVSAIAAVFLFFIVGTYVIKTEWKTLPSDLYGINATQEGALNTTSLGTYKIVDGTNQTQNIGVVNGSSYTSGSVVQNSSTPSSGALSDNLGQSATPTPKTKSTPTPIVSATSKSILKPTDTATFTSNDESQINYSEINVFNDNNNYADFSKKIIVNSGGSLIYNDNKDNLDTYDYEINKNVFDTVVAKLINVESIKKELLTPLISISELKRSADSSLTSNMKNLAENWIIRIIINK